MSSTATFPHLPVELLEQIMATAWHMPLSSEERIAFIRSSTLVNSTWAALFTLISSRDVFIPSSSFCDHFLQQLRAPPIVDAPPTFLDRLLCRPKPSKPETRSANLACQSITIQIANIDVHPGAKARMRLPMASVLEELLENLDARALAPNLRRLSIEYLDAGFDDLFQRQGLASLPSHVTHLELKFSFDPKTPVWLVKSLRENQERQRRMKWLLRSVTKLSVTGAGDNVVKDVLRACPNTNVLVVDSSAVLRGAGLESLKTRLE
ncbi:hypothetical protein C8J57DRAFT_461215 [Mycena rebaudengoi]|nr:hypothetical protein C8J57DRAFT_461215 [Mycena rebaudengoi]